MSDDINKAFKWIALIFSFLLIIIGCLSIYDCEKTLILIGFLTILLASILLFFIIYILKNNPTYWALTVLFMILFGMSIGIVAIIDGMQHNLVGWVVGGLSTTLGITSIIWTLLALFQLYKIKPFDGLPKWI